VLKFLAWPLALYSALAPATHRTALYQHDVVAQQQPDEPKVPWKPFITCPLPLNPVCWRRSSRSVPDRPRPGLSGSLDLNYRIFPCN
jgi:hypothetical protein